MSVPPPGGDPNANRYAQLKRDILDRVPQITAVEYVPDDIEVTPSTGDGRLHPQRFLFGLCRNPQQLTIVACEIQRV